MYTKKLVICSPNIKNKTLKKLSKVLSDKLGYYVYRVFPHRVRNRTPVHFLSGIDKRIQLQAFHDCNVPAPLFSTTLGGINSFTGRNVVARQLTKSCEGRGISIHSREETLPLAPLYTEYIPKKKEFRVHIWNGEVIDVSEKRKKRGFEEGRNTQIRNTLNGYVFCRNEIIEPDDLRPIAINAVNSLGRTYGAVDVIWNEKQNKCFVLEVNSRPGLEGTTLEKYANAILKGLNDVR